MIKPLPFRPENSDATAYVATQPEEGLAQLEVLKKLGCQPHHKVLEIGCGALVAGFPIMQHLDVGNYSGVEPNMWLASASMSIPEVAATVVDKRPEFYPRSDFRVDSGSRFDFIISHSILSHASSVQLTDFLVAAASQLNEGGVLAASIRLAEGNSVGSPGSPRHGSDFTEWQYPGVSWFKKEDVLERARRLGLSATVSGELTRIIMSGNSKAVHDWIVVRKTKVALVTGFFRLPDRPVDEDQQFRMFDCLAECGLPVTLFLDTELLPYTNRRKNVCVIPTPLHSLPAFRWANDRDLKLPEHRDPTKDTRDFLLLQNSKLDLLKRAQDSDTEPTHFAWIDFGVMKVVQDSKTFLERLRRLAPPSSCALFPGCWSAEQAAERPSADMVSWRFCGGFFVVDRDTLPRLAQRHRATLEAHRTLTWEVNVWAEMERAGQKFDWYKADPNFTDAALTEVEKKNIATIAAYEKRAVTAMSTIEG